MWFFKIRSFDPVDRKLALSFGALVMILMLTLTGVAVALFAQLQHKEENRLTHAMAVMLDEAIARISFSGRYQTRLLVEEMCSRVPGLLYISMETPEGKIVASSDPSQNDRFADPEAIKIDHAVLKSSGALVGDRVWHGKNVSEIVIPCQGGLESQDLGVVRLGIDVELARGQQRATLMKLLLLIAVLWGGATIVVALLSHAFGGTVRALATQQRAMIANITDVIAIIDACGVIRYKSPNIEKWFGWRPEDVVGRSTWDNIHPDDLPRVAGIFEGVMRQPGVPATGESRYRCRDGSYKWIEFSAANLLDDPAIRGVLVNYHEISARRLAEESLRASEERYREIFNSTSDVLFIHDESGQILDVNERMLAMFGYDRETALSLTLKDLSLGEAPYDQAHAERHVRRAVVCGSHMFEWRGRRKGGELFWGEVALHTCEILGRRRVIASVRDITERKATAEALLREKTLTEAILDSTPGIIYLYNEKSQLVRWNRKHEELTGYSGEELAGMSLMDWYRDDEKSQAAVLAGVRNTLRTGFGDAEAEMQRKDGVKIPMYFTACPLSIDGNTYFVGIGIDMTERVRAQQAHNHLQEQLLQAQKMESIGRLAGGVAHDFNNMLGVIIGHAELALAEELSSSVRSDLLEILKAAQRSADLTRQLLAFARKQTISPRVLDLNDTIEGLLRMLRRLIGEDIELSWKPGAGLWPVKMDPTQVDQILANLSVNARDAMEKGGVLSIETENIRVSPAAMENRGGPDGGDYVVVTVSDTGIGMDKATIAHLFEPFFTTKEVGKGTGLGLATVYGAVRQNHGFVNVYSEPGKGSAFRIYLPRTRDAGTEATEPKPESPRFGTETVLLTEDEEAILDMGRIILERYGYTVLTAATPAEALALAQSYDGPIHLLITDVVMPGLNGRELKNRLDLLRPGLKVLYMSGYTADVIAYHGILDENVEFLQKPFSVLTLTAKVREMLDA